MGPESLQINIHQWGQTCQLTYVDVTSRNTSITNEGLLPFKDICFRSFVLKWNLSFPLFFLLGSLMCYNGRLVNKKLGLIFLTRIRRHFFFWKLDSLLFSWQGDPPCLWQDLPRVPALAAGHSAVLPLQMDHGTHSKEKPSQPGSWHR